MSTDSGSEQTSLEAFRALYRKDLSAEGVRPLSEYLARFPEDEESVAREYVTLREGDRVDGQVELGEMVGPYRPIKELGRGGQGVVYLAEDTRLGRKVALKVLTRLGPGSEHVLARFKREAEVTSRLEHPGICGVMDAAIDGAVPYIAMRFVDGRSLAMIIADSRAEPEKAGHHSIISFDDDAEAAGDETVAPTDDQAPSDKAPTRREITRVIRIFEAAARALHAAHEAGVVHRDIKPGNIVIGKGDQPVLLDFGMAHDDTGDGPSLTQSGDLFGTPAYMSPEQLAAQRIMVDKRTDVWSLGVTLYECLTLRRPFEAPTRQALYQTIMTQDPTDPQRFNPAIPEDLKVVLETTLEKDRNRRYQSALELAEELRRIRCYEPITARPAGHLLRLRRWSQRNPAVATLVAALIVLLPVISWMVSDSRGSHERAVLAQEKAEAESALRSKIEAEAVQALRDQRERVFAQRLDEIGARMSLLVHVFRGKAAYHRQLAAYLDAFKDFGLPFDGSVSKAELLRRLQELNAREPRLARLTLNGIFSLDYMARGAGIANSKEPEHARVQRMTRLAQEIGAEGETDPWYRRLDVAFKVFEKTGDRKIFEPFHSGEALRGLRADQLMNLAYVMIDQQFNLDETLPLRLIDLALDLKPDSFALHFTRGGVTMQEYGRNMDPAILARALHHFEVALALRPNSGLSWAMLGMARAARIGQPGSGMEDIRRSLQALERSTSVAPDSPLCWCLKGLFYGMAGAQAKNSAIAALEKALSLDASFDAAKDALKLVKAGKKPQILRPRFR